VAITGGSVTGIADLAVADGGTGASTAADARTNLNVYAKPAAAHPSVTALLAIAADGVTPIFVPELTFSGSFHSTTVGGQTIVVHKTDFAAATQTYIAATGLRDTAAFVIDDVVRMLSGETSANSLRGSTWTVLSANRWTNLKGAYLFQSALNASSGTTVVDLRGNKNLTIGGGMLWNENGFTFDGVDDVLTGTGSHLTSGQWSAFAVASASSANKTFLSQNNGLLLNFRTGFLINTSSNTWGIFKRVDPTSTTVDSLASSATMKSVFSVQTATALNMHADGSDTVLATAAVAATTIENTDFQIGKVGPAYFAGSSKLAMLFGENVTSDYPEIHANLNALLGLGL
jgi:hypothetical protein